MVSVVRITSADDIVLNDINALLWDLRTDQNEPTGGEEDLKTIVSNPNVIFVAAKDKRNVIGMGTIYLMHKFGKISGSVEDVVVSERYRGQGLGQKIMETLITEAKKAGANQLYLTSKPDRIAAHKLYEKVGFKIKDTDVFQLKL